MKQAEEKGTFHCALDSEEGDEEFEQAAEESQVCIRTKMKLAPVALNLNPINFPSM